MKSISVLLTVLIFSINCNANTFNKRLSPTESTNNIEYIYLAPTTFEKEFNYNVTPVDTTELILKIEELEERIDELDERISRATGLHAISFFGIAFAIAVGLGWISLGR